MTLPKGHPGMIAIRSIQTQIKTGFATVPSGTRKIKPGDGVFYDTTATNNAPWRLPTTTSESLNVHGVVSRGESGEIEIGDSAPIKVITEGIVWVVAGGKINYGDLLRFSHATSGPTSNTWISYSIPDAATPTLATRPSDPAEALNIAAAHAVNTAVNALRDALPKRSIFAMTEATNPGELIQARLTGAVLR